MDEHRTFIFNKINALEQFKIFIDQYAISPPAKINNRQSLPYKSGAYNFDEVIGFPTFEEREITYTCQLIEDDTRDLELTLTEINNWLLMPVKAELQDTATPEYHFLGECINVIPAENERGFCEITITFKCYPFKIWNTADTNDWLWDNFDLEHGIVPTTEFELVVGKNIEIYNHSVVPIPFTPTFEAYRVLVMVDNVRYTLTSGTEASFLLYPGSNIINITNIEGGMKKNIMTISMIREEL